MDISKYPVTTPFGWVKGYPLNQSDPVNHPGEGFHNGIDYGLPMGTPVVVKGVTIGLSNNTGSTTGPHLHVGRYAGGAATNPGEGNGFKFTSAVVYDTGHDSVNGNFVRLNADGALWNYLHLESILVSKGQVLNAPPQGDTDMLEDPGDSYNVGDLFGEGDNHKFVGQAWSAVFYYYIAGKVKSLKDSLSSATNIAQDRYDFTRKIADSLGVPDTLPEADVNQQTLQKIADLKVQAGGADAEANALGKALIALLTKFGYKKG